jgi:hypothetical protein
MGCGFAGGAWAPADVAVNRRRATATCVLMS